MQWQRNRGKAITELFDELPLAFQAELSLETYRSMIDRVGEINIYTIVNVFNGLTIEHVIQSTLFRGAPEEFMRMLSLVVKHMLYLPQQVRLIELLHASIPFAMSTQTNDGLSLSR